MGLWVTKSPFPTNEREDTQGASRRYEGMCTQLACSRLATGSETSEGAFPECLWSLAEAFPLDWLVLALPAPCTPSLSLSPGEGHGPCASAVPSAAGCLGAVTAWSCDSTRLVHFEPDLVSAAQMAGIQAEVCVGPMAEHRPD